MNCIRCPCTPVYHVALDIHAAPTMRGKRPVNPFAHRARLVCRGRMYAARQTLRGQVFTGRRGVDARIVGRWERQKKTVTDGGAGFAAGSRPRPTGQNKQAIFPQPPRGANPCRAACMPPLRIDRTPSQPKNDIVRRTTGPVYFSRGIAARPPSFFIFIFSFFTRVCSQYSPMLAPGRPVHSSAR